MFRVIIVRSSLVKGHISLKDVSQFQDTKILFPENPQAIVYNVTMSCCRRQFGLSAGDNSLSAAGKKKSFDVQGFLYKGFCWRDTYLVHELKIRALGPI